MARMYRVMRRNALIGPWGVGAIVPFPNDESLMIAGLDMWRYHDKEAFLIKDDRLQRRLGVTELRWPPDFREKSADPDNYNLTIPTVRFPRWCYCPFCGTMHKTGFFTKQPTCEGYPWPNGRKCKPGARYPQKLIPERFIVVCPEGHIDDFPIIQWVHSNSEHSYDPSKCRIRRSTGGTSAGLSGIRYECLCGASRTMAGAMNPGMLDKIGYKCKGAKPWLGISEGTCNCDPKKIKVLQRGATNVWFATTCSSIYIPTKDEQLERKLQAALKECYDMVTGHRVNGELNRDFIEMYAAKYKVDADDLFKAIENKLNDEENNAISESDINEDQYRFAEYKMLIRNSGADSQDFHCENHLIKEYHHYLGQFFKSISIVKKLRETRAFTGFTRLEPATVLNPQKSKKELRIGNGNWLPAIVVYGEGIFFEFREDTLKKWAALPNVQERINLLNHSYRSSFFGKHAVGVLRPEFVLLHTFAHLIINQLSYECGYGSSSIRERIYCEKTSNELNMLGVLIYTASGDSEGSLGGLVRQGLPGRIEDTIHSALENAKWCSSDPVCIQSSGQGPESCNLAACHNCALLPETCCENGNRLLDRGFLIGTLEHPETGLFNEGDLRL